VEAVAGQMRRASTVVQAAEAKREEAKAKAEAAKTPT
jgi:hypothetical protein